MKKITKFISSIVTAAVVIPTLTFSVYASESREGVRVVVENNTFSAADGAAWEGTLIDEWVDIDNRTSAKELFEKVLTSHGYTQTGAENNWITEINGLSAGADPAQSGGWMVGFNDWYGNGGITTLNVENGDEIMLSYSLNWGADIGSDYMSVSTKLISIEPDSGELSPAFSSEITEYVLTLPYGAQSVRLVPTAENKSYRYKIYKNNYTPDDELTDYKRTESIPVANGDVLYIGVGHDSWHSYMPEGAAETVYKISVSCASTENSDTDSTADTDDSGVPSLPDTQKGDSDVTVDSMISAVYSQITPKNNNYLPGDEWVLLSNCRLGLSTYKDTGNYLTKLDETIKNDPPKRATDFAKYILALTAIGENPTDWNGTDFTAALSNFDFAVKQGINGTAYTLIALDSKNYDIPTAADGEQQTTREKLITALLDAQLEDGGWAFFGSVYEPDMTGIVLQALSPYYNKDAAVTKAVDRALKLLCEKQNDDGTYTSYGEPNCENSAQIIIALSALGIDADKDERFKKAGGSVLDGLKDFYLSELGSFSHTLNGEKNMLSTVQAYEALCAYKLLQTGRNSFYNMTDSAVSTESDSQQSSSSADSSQNGNSSGNNSQTGNTQAAAPASQSNSAVATGDKSGAAILLVIMTFAVLTSISANNSKNKSNE